jgi:hypothetical protein
MTADIPNAFVQLDIDEKEKGVRIIMRIECSLVNMLTELSPKTYEKYVVYEGNNNKVLMNFLKATQNEVASMSADETQSIKWYVDVAFAVHKDLKVSQELRCHLEMELFVLCL